MKLWFLNASYVCLHTFSLHRESPDPDPGRRTPHFWGGSIQTPLVTRSFSMISGNMNDRWLHPDGQQRHPDGPWPTPTWQCHREQDPASSSPAWLGGNIMPWPALPQQRHHQHDRLRRRSVLAPHAWLRRYGSNIASMTRHRHHAMTNVTSAVPLLAWLGINVAPWPSHLGGEIVIMTRGAWHLLPWLAIQLGGSPPIKLGCLRSIMAQLGYTFTYIADLNSRRVRRHHDDMGHFPKPAKSFC
jgi:hypothetical protein